MRNRCATRRQSTVILHSSVMIDTNSSAGERSVGKRLPRNRNSNRVVGAESQGKGRVRSARMPQALVPTYRVEYEPSRGLWLLTGPVGAKLVTQR